MEKYLQVMNLSEVQEALSGTLVDHLREAFPNGLPEGTMPTTSVNERGVTSK